jgi:hypothetical protein
VRNQDGLHLVRVEPRPPRLRGGGEVEDGEVTTVVSADADDPPGAHHREGHATLGVAEGNHHRRRCSAPSGNEDGVGGLLAVLVLHHEVHQFGAGILCC